MILLLTALSLTEPCAIVHAKARVPALLVRRGMPAGDAEIGFITYVAPGAEGLVVIDPAVGRDTPAHLRQLPFWVRAWMPDFSAAPTASGVLAGQRIEAVLVTHAHWDHLSGAGDLAAPVVLPLDDALWARRSGNAGVLRELVPFNDRAFSLHGPPLFGFGASQEVLPGVLALPVPGHTPGSVAYLVQGRWLFIGDASWEAGQERAKVSAALDESSEDSGRSAAAIAALQRARPGLVVLPAHDLRAAARLSACRF